EDPRVAVLVGLAACERAVGFALCGDPLVLTENAQDPHFRIAGLEETADRSEQLVDDLVPSSRDAGSGNGLARRLPAAVDVNQRSHRFEIAGAERFEKRADEPLVARLFAVAHRFPPPRRRAAEARIVWVPATPVHARHAHASRRVLAKRRRPRALVGARRRCVRIAATRRRSLPTGASRARSQRVGTARTRTSPASHRGGLVCSMSPVSGWAERSLR